MERSKAQMRVPEEFQHLIEQFPKTKADSGVSPVQQTVATDERSTVRQAENAPYIIDHELQD